MLFNSFEFALFLPLMFVVYWYLCSRRWRIQNVVLLAGSLVFYGWWDPRFLGLMLFSAVLDFTVGNLIHRARSVALRRGLLGISIGVNFGILGVFKYYNFFAESLNDALSACGIGPATARLDLVLPVGISFYTFQTVSSSIDIYRGTLTPTRDLVAYLSFVTFFPQLVAGPIERAGHLLPQFLRRREFRLADASDGCRQALWGLFKKVVIADNCAALANQVFGAPVEASWAALLAGTFLFTMQIYCDFSGYSDIAVGTARLFGFSLMQNFATPYFSRDIGEFWRRWHISLSTWFRDYVYLPLGGSRCAKGRMIRNTLAVFLISGLWHGANWTFVVWGLLNAVYFLPLQLSGANRRYTSQTEAAPLVPSLREVLQIGTTFVLTMMAWIFFRAASLSDAWTVLRRMFTLQPGSALEVSSEIWLLVTGFLLVEWVQRSQQHALELQDRPLPRWARWCCYYMVLFLILTFGGEQQDFIYFQF
jgi:D-alanyl-lipoteichoic acid acyltransferase DltB (MBOAT superfamily)